MPKYLKKIDLRLLNKVTYTYVQVKNQKVVMQSLTND